MSLRDILQKMVDEENSASLSDGNTTAGPAEFLNTMSEPMLRRQAYLQPGLYIAEINEGGYLGQVLLKFAKSA
jgi:hypothetical protein